MEFQQDQRLNAAINFSKSTAVDKQTSSTRIPDQQVKHLIVQDNPVYQCLFTNSLKKLVIAFHIAENGQKAAEVYKADPEKPW